MKKPNVNNIKITINNNLEYLRKTYGVKDIGVFGSVASGQSTPLSDIDMLVEFSQPIGFFKFTELENYLSKILRKKVDLVTKKALKPAIKEDVLREIIYV